MAGEPCKRDRFYPCQECGECGRYDKPDPEEDPFIESDFEERRLEDAGHGIIQER